MKTHLLFNNSSCSLCFLQVVTAQKLQVHCGQQVVQVWISHLVDCLTTAGILNFKFLGRKFHLTSSESWKQECGQQKVRGLKSYGSLSVKS